MVRASSAFAAVVSLALAASTNAYWLMSTEFITTERIDPIVNPGQVSGHVHSVIGGSNFGFEVTTEKLRKSQCTSLPIKEDKSNYWFPHLYFQWKNGSFSSVGGGSVIYYLFPNKAGATKPFPPDFRMITGNPRMRSYDPSSHASQAVDFLCLNFDGGTTKHVMLPEKSCKHGIRAQVNFPSCWNGKDVDSPDHKSHVAYRSGGPDSGECLDPKFPVSIPRIFLEVYWGTNQFDNVRDQAMNPIQPFVYSYGDNTGYGNHADFYNGWEPDALQRAIDGCHCDNNGSPKCCADKGIFTFLDGNQDTDCRITKQVDETTTGTLPKLPGNNPVQPAPGPAQMLTSNVIPAKLAPAYVYTGQQPTTIGKVVTPATTLGGGNPPPSSTPPAVSSSAPPPPPSSSVVAPPPASSSAAPPPPPPSSVAPPPPPPSSSAAGGPGASYSAPASSTKKPGPTGGNPPKPTGKNPPGPPKPNPPANTASVAPTSKPTPPPPVVSGKPTTVRTYISTRYTKPTGVCKPKKKKNGTKSGHSHHNHHGLHKRRAGSADEFYSLH